MLQFLRAKRRKTAHDEFAEPDAPGGRRGGRGGGAAPSSPTPPTTVVFDQLCSTRDSPLQPADLRMVIMEGEPRRAVVFDSAAITPVIPGTSTEGMHLSNCKRFQFLRKRRDVTSLSQLVWGAMPTLHGADALKFHHLAEEEKMLISRVFNMPRIFNRDPRCNTESLPSSDSESQYLSTVRSLDGCTKGSLASTAPPEQFTRVRNTSFGLDADECDQLEMRAFSPPHRLSKNRRIQMSHKNSLCESGQSTPWKGRSRLSSCSSQPEDEPTRQVAVAITVSYEHRAFLLQHMPIVETEVSRLEGRVSNAAMHPPTFINNVHKAWEEFTQSICHLYNSPRLRNPVWLSLAEKDLNDSEVASDFCGHLAALVRQLDTKNTKFFLSNVVSTVLMNHMSWVASVASPQTAPVQQQPAADRNLLIGTALNSDSSSIPYNPHMAQYLEISGSVGNTHRSTKTVVVGHDSEELSAVLHVLSYFIRCSTVQHRTSSDSTQPLPLSQSFSPEAASPETAGSPPLIGIRDMAFSQEKGNAVDDDVEVMSSCSMDSLPGIRFQSTGSTDDSHPLALAPRSAGGLSPDCLGRSLLAGPSTVYSPHFVLQGLVKSGGNTDDAFSKMLDDVRCEETAIHRAAAVSLSSSQGSSSICEVQLPDSIVILADLSNWSVKVVSSDGLGEVHSPSEAVVSLLEEFAELHGAGCAPKFLITLLEDRLAEILGKSLSLVEMVSGSSQSTPQMLSPDRVRSVIGCDHSDLRLILNVASVYYPPVLSSVI